MEIKINVPEYSTSDGFTFNWENGFSIKTEIVNGSIVIKANKEGLISLANHLLNLSQETVPNSYHIHLDDLNGLDTDSVGLVLEKDIK